MTNRNPDLPPTELPAHPRILVVGSTGAGKSTLGRALAAKLSIPHVELDALHWEPEWVPAPREVFRARTAAAAAGEEWVVDGNYKSGVRDILWPRANVLVWIDLPLHVHLRRLLKRTLRRWWRRELLWGTNRERLRDNFLSKDSLFVWLFQSHARNRRDYASVPNRPEYAHLLYVRLRSEPEVNQWLAQARCIDTPDHPLRSSPA